MPRIEDIGVFNTVRESGHGQAGARRCRGSPSAWEPVAAATARKACITPSPKPSTAAAPTSISPASAASAPATRSRWSMCTCRAAAAHPAAACRPTMPARILHDLTTGNVTPELVYCKIEEWDHITGAIRYGHGYPEDAVLERSPVLQGAEEDRPAQLRADQSRRHRGVHRRRRIPGALQDAHRRQARRSSSSR